MRPRGRGLQRKGVSAPPAWQTSTYNAAGGTYNFTVPSGTASGDVLLVCLSQINNASPNDLTLPAGYTLLVRTANFNGGADYARHNIWWRVCDGSESGTVSFTGSSGFSQGTAHRFSGCHQSSPVDSYVTASGTANPLVHGGITPAYNNELLVTFSTGTFFTDPAPSGYTKRGSSDGVFVYTKTAPAISVATGNVSFAGNSGCTQAVVLGLRSP